MNVILSIKPKYVNQIKIGIKRYEFRKILFSKEKIKDIKKVYLYSSFPIKKIVAKFEIGEILKDHPQRLWDKCKDWSGMDEIDFFRYFKNKERGIAIKMTNLKFFKIPIDPRTIIHNFVPPQSFSYVDNIEENISIQDF